MAGLFNDFNPIQGLVANQNNLATQTITRGSLISFNYPQSWALSHQNVIHDPKPMVILTDIWAPHYIRGVNLHYLTFPYVKRILQYWAGNQSFAYSTIKADKYLTSAFRMYVIKGISQPKRLDSEWLKTVLNSVLSFDVGEVEKIKTTIQQQIQSRLQTKANQLTEYDAWRKNLAQRRLQNQAMGMQNLLGNQRNLATPPETGEIDWQ